MNAQLRDPVDGDHTYGRFVKHLWAHREIEASADVAWRLFTDVDRWPEWGPSIVRATLDGEQFQSGATGSVTTAVAVDVRFEITECRAGTYWAWKVASLPATHHSVESLGGDRCRMGFGVPWVAAPYLAICELALRRLDDLAQREMLHSAGTVSR